MTKGTRSAAEHFARDPRGVLRVADLRDQDHELIASDACQRVLFTDRGAQPLRALPQQLVAHRTAQAVVDGLEAVEVEEQHGAGPLLSLGARKRLRETVEQERPVGETRQGIMVGQCLDAGLGKLSFGDIQHRAHHAYRPPLPVANDEAAVLDLRIATVTAVKTVLV
jgi:hypothetical protein